MKKENLRKMLRKISLKKVQGHSLEIAIIQLNSTLKRGVASQCANQESNKVEKYSKTICTG